MSIHSDVTHFVGKIIIVSKLIILFVGELGCLDTDRLSWRNIDFLLRRVPVF
jgi:hypothetical protein